MDCKRLKEDFPELSRRNVVFLDNAASSLKPTTVIEAMREFSYNSYANVHRGSYEISLEASRAYEEAHEIVADFIGAGSWEEVVFTKNSTEAMQLIALTLAYNRVIGPGEEVIVTEADHHSTQLPWARISKFVGAEFKLLPVDVEGVPKWDMLEEMISEKTKVVAFAHVSNVTGYVSDVRRIARVVHENGGLVIVDGAQSVPHIPVNVREMDADFMVFSGHKMLGPTGIGVMWGRLEHLRRLEPPMAGGGTVKRVRRAGVSVEAEWDDPPWRFEAGTPPIIEAVGLAEAVRYLSKVGMENVESHERALTDVILKGLSEYGDKLSIAGPRESKRRQGIVSFTVEGSNPDMVGLWLDSRGIAVRAGLHCAHTLHDALGMPEGTVRASVYLYNCEEDVRLLLEAVGEYIEVSSRRGK